MRNHRHEPGPGQPPNDGSELDAKLVDPAEAFEQSDAATLAFCERAGRILREESLSDPARVSALHERVWDHIEAFEKQRSRAGFQAGLRGLLGTLGQTSLGRVAAALLVVQIAAVPVLAWIALRPAEEPAPLNIRVQPQAQSQPAAEPSAALGPRPAESNDPGRFENRARLDRLRASARLRGHDPSGWPQPALMPRLSELIDLRFGVLESERLPQPQASDSTLERAALLEVWLDAWAIRPDQTSLMQFLPGELVAPRPARPGDSAAEIELYQATLSRARAYGAVLVGQSEVTPTGDCLDFLARLQKLRPDWASDPAWRVRFELGDAR